LLSAPASDLYTVAMVVDFDFDFDLI